MKKIFATLALAMGLSTSVALAGNVFDEFVVIELKDVPQAVQDAVAKNYEGSTIKEAHAETAEDGTKTYKLIVVDANQAETILLFNEKGELVKEAE